METKQMTIADLNVVFGKEEEPLLHYVDSIVIKALNSDFFRVSTNDTKFFFKDTKIIEIDENEFVLCGILIKDTVLNIKSKYNEEVGLEKKNDKIQSSPYSVFMIYLKNHRMVLVKNQSSSPDIRSFSSTFREILGEYIKTENRKRKQEERKLLPYAMVSVNGIKTAASVREALKNVEKIESITFKLRPLNSEWDYEGSVFGSIDKEIRKTIQSKKGTMSFPSPQSKEGVAEIIEASQGLVKTEMKVKYNTDVSLSGTKSRGKIRDNEISEVVNIDIDKELEEAYDEIHNHGKEIKALNVQTRNHIIDYSHYINNRKRK